MSTNYETGIPARAGGAVVGGVGVLLRLEGLALFLSATAVFAHLHGSWWTYLLLFLAPDLSFVAYLVGPKPGAVAYNALHSSIGALLLGTAGYLAGAPSAGSIIALIWLAHIGFDRAAGFGLKYATAFGDTHLGLTGTSLRTL
jgi:uncharacterized protein DUF4260